MGPRGPGHRARSVPAVPVSGLVGGRRDEPLDRRDPQVRRVRVGGHRSSTRTGRRPHRGPPGPGPPNHRRHRPGGVVVDGPVTALPPPVRHVPGRRGRRDQSGRRPGPWLGRRVPRRLGVHAVPATSGPSVSGWPESTWARSERPATSTPRSSSVPTRPPSGASSPTSDTTRRSVPRSRSGDAAASRRWARPDRAQDRSAAHTPRPSTARSWVNTGVTGLSLSCSLTITATDREPSAVAAAKMV